MVSPRLAFIWRSYNCSRIYVPTIRSRLMVASFLFGKWIYSKFLVCFACMSNSILYFKGRVLFSYRGISMLFFIFMISFVFIPLVRESTGYMIVVYAISYLLIISIIVFYFGWQLCYFGVSSKQLIIRNPIFFWWRRTILFSEIKSIRIDMTTIGRRSRPYGPYYLRVFFDSLKTQKFYAGTLNGRKWALLSEELEKNEIKVTNMVPYVPFRDML